MDTLDDLRPDPGKSCGSCTACCSVLPVRELKLKAWEGCRHLRQLPMLPGCGIYSKRPPSCRIWSCGWRITPPENWPDDLRPDRCGAIVDPIDDLIWINGKETVAARIWVIPGFEDAWRTDPVQALIAAIVLGADRAVLWDMPPDAEGNRLGLVFLNEGGRLAVSTPQGITPDSRIGMSSGERMRRARKLAGDFPS